MKPEKIISICIPTFNRNEVLKELLDCLKSQYRPDLEIIICDNGTDETDKLVKNYPVIYHRNSKDIGADKNLLQTIEFASGKYCWLMNDSSCLIDGAVDFIIEAIKTDCDVYITKAGYKGSAIYKNGSEAIKYEEPFGGKLNRVILKRTIAIKTEAQPRGKNGWVHLEIALKMAANGRVGFIKELLCRPQHSFSSKWAQIDGNVFFAYTNLFDIFSSSIGWGYDADVIRKVKRKLEFNLPLTLVSARLYGLKISWENFKYLLKFKSVLPITIPIFLTPRFVFKWLKLLQIRLRHIAQ